MLEATGERSRRPQRSTRQQAAPMLNAVLRNVARRDPDGLAIACGALELTYAEFERAVARSAAGFQARGVTKGSVVAMSLPNSAEFAIGFYAIARLGAIAFPLNPAVSHHELQRTLAPVGVSLVITSAQRLAECSMAVERAGLAAAVMSLDAAHLARGANAGSSERDNAQGAFDGPVLFANSSGSTDIPKLVQRTQANLVQEAANFARTIAFNASDRILCVVPLYHAHGLGNCLLASIQAGSTLTILEPAVRAGIEIEAPLALRTTRLLQLLGQTTVLPAAPVIIALLAGCTKGRPVNGLRYVFSAGAPLPAKTFDAFRQRFGLPVRQIYGCTEAGAITIDRDRDELVRSDCAGSPVHGVELRIVDEVGETLGERQIGEIAVRSGAIAAGVDSLTNEGFFRTGDLGWCDDAGRVFLTGRKSAMIEQNGHKIIAGEVEAVLASHPMIVEAAVVRSANAAGLPVAKAVVVVRGPISAHDIVQFCKERLASYKAPRQIEFRTALPKSPLGKLLRSKLIG